MKKRARFALLAAVLLSALLLSSCGSFNYKTEDLSRYVTLGAYKNLALEVKMPDKVDDEAVEKELKALLETAETTKLAEDDYAAADGDTVNIDYVGKIDGEAFDGGTAEGQNLVLGSGSYIEGFEDGLIGKKKGDTATLNLTFPDPYTSNTDLSGKAVVFEVTVNSVSVPAYAYDKELAEGDLTEEGDTLTVTFSATVGGEKFEGSEGEGVSLTLGEESDALPAAVAEKLVGVKVGEEQKITVTLPEDFSVTDAAGKSAEYTVTVTKAAREILTAEITDELVAAETEYETAAKARETLKEKLEETYEKNAAKAKYSTLWKAILDNAEVKSYPSSALKEAVQKNYDYYDSIAGLYYKLSLREYAKSTGYASLSEFKEKVCVPAAEESIKEKLVFYSLLKAEGWEVSDEELEAKVEELYAEQSEEDYPTLEDFDAIVDHDAVRDTLLWEKGMETLLATASVTEK
ncbi:MAG: FKBP-type peptidyl-prolyl cis-trans isomerase [Clostridia bacterium]|nr:FKBP-type peptidyl-prolyl cis-trans isomerase [Clostridia bacterium]